MALVFVTVWLAVAAATRYSSAGALAASAATPLALVIDGRRDVAVLYGLLTVLAWWLHRANIARLLAGTNSKIGAKTAAEEA